MARNIVEISAKQGLITSLLNKSEEFRDHYRNLEELSRIRFTKDHVNNLLPLVISDLFSTDDNQHTAYIFLLHHENEFEQ